MEKYFIKKIKDLDQFAFNPEKAININGKSKFSTIPGGVQSILLRTLFFVFWYQNFSHMFLYQKNSISSNSSAVDLIALGNVEISKIKSLPFVAPYYKGSAVPRTSQSMCGEFGGDCFKWFNKYLKTRWNNLRCVSEFAPCENNYFESR